MLVWWWFQSTAPLSSRMQCSGSQSMLVELCLQRSECSCQYSLLGDDSLLNWSGLRALSWLARQAVARRHTATGIQGSTHWLEWETIFVAFNSPLCSYGHVYRFLRIVLVANNNYSNGINDIAEYFYFLILMVMKVNRNSSTHYRKIWEEYVNEDMSAWSYSQNWYRMWRGYVALRHHGQYVWPT